MFEVGDKVRVQVHAPFAATYAATIEQVGRPGTWYPGGAATKVTVRPDDGRPAREVLSRDLTLIRSTPTPKVTMDPIGPLCVVCGKETDSRASLPTNGARIHVQCNADVNALSDAQDARPDLDLVAILPRTEEDGPFLRTFRTRDGQTVMLRMPDPNPSSVQYAAPIGPDLEAAPPVAYVTAVAREVYFACNSGSRLSDALDIGFALTPCTPYGVDPGSEPTPYERAAVHAVRDIMAEDFSADRAHAVLILPRDRGGAIVYVSIGHKMRWYRVEATEHTIVSVQTVRRLPADWGSLIEVNDPSGD